MNQRLTEVMKEGIGLAEQIASIPFKAVRVLVEDSALSKRPIGSVVRDSLAMSEGFARLPFKAANALVEELREKSREP